MFKVPCVVLCAALALLVSNPLVSAADEAKLPIPAAILPFEARGSVKE